MTQRGSLGIEIEELPSGVVVERELGSRDVISSFGGFGEGFVDGATAIDDDARPGSGIRHFVLPHER